MNNKTLKVFESFSGYGSQRMALRNIGIDFESVGISEVDIPAILSYASIHDGLGTEDNTFVYPSKEEMIKFLEERNVGLDFKTKKVKLPKNLAKLQQLYRAVVLSKCYGDVCLLKPQELPDMDLFTYSFPCTDISVAGQQQGVVKGQTRSGLLYECEKIIEVKRPKYLLLENVKNLVGKKFKEQFDGWLNYLESLGYTNYWQVLNSKDYGVPQNRERVFVVSILNDEDKDYVFPQKQPLNIRLKDVLESQVEEKYYLSDEVQARFKPNNKFKDMSGNIVGTTAPEFRTIGQRDLCYQENSVMGTLVATDYKQPKQIVELNKNKQNAIGIIKHLEETEQLNEDITTCDMSINSPKAKDVANCITARYDCGVSNNKSVGVAVVERIGGRFDDEKGTHQAGSVYNQEGLSPTLDTMQGGYRQPCVIDEPNPINFIVGSTQKNAFVGDGTFSPTLTSAMGTGGGHVPMISINESRLNALTQLLDKLDKATDEDNIEKTKFEIFEEFGTQCNCPKCGTQLLVSDLPEYKYLCLECYENFYEVEVGKCEPNYLVKNEVVEPNFDEMLKGTNYARNFGCKGKVQKENEVCGTLMSAMGSGGGNIPITYQSYRIRKLTPLECWRLMGCSDEDFYKAKQFNSDSQLYKQAGNSIVVDVLEGIFYQLLNK